MNAQPEFDLFGDPIIVHTKPKKEPVPEQVLIPQTQTQTERVQQAKLLLDFFLAGGCITAIDALECLGIA